MIPISLDVISTNICTFIISLSIVESKNLTYLRFFFDRLAFAVPFLLGLGIGIGSLAQYEDNLNAELIAAIDIIADIKDFVFISFSPLIR